MSAAVCHCGERAHRREGYGFTLCDRHWEDQIARDKAMFAKWREQDAERERVGDDHASAHDRATRAERRITDLLDKGRTEEAIAIGLLAISVRLDEIALKLEHLEYLG